MLFFVQPSFTFSESIYVWNSRTDSCSCQTGKINGIDFRALIRGNGYYDSDARVWNLSLVEDSGWYLVGGKSVINWASYSQIDWIQPCRFRDGNFTFSLCPAFVIPTYLPHQIINLEPSIAPGSRISTSNLPLLCSQHFLSQKGFDIGLYVTLFDTRLEKNKMTEGYKTDKEAFVSGWLAPR